MILVLFSSAEDALFKSVKNMTLIELSQGTENPPFRIFWDTRCTMAKLCYILYHPWLPMSPTDLTEPSVCQKVIRNVVASVASRLTYCHA